MPRRLATYPACVASCPLAAFTSSPRHRCCSRRSRHALPTTTSTAPKTPSRRPTRYAAATARRLPACKDGSFNLLGREVDAAVKAALAKAPPTTVPILKRDQFWFREMIGNAVDDAAHVGDDQRDAQKRILDSAIATLHQRIEMLRAMAQGFGRAGVVGRWASAFGTVEITLAGHDAFNVVLSSKASYGGSEDYLRQSCKASVVVRLAPTDGFPARSPQAATAPARRRHGGSRAAENPPARRQSAGVGGR